MAQVFIGIGSNIEPERNVRESIVLMRREVRVVAISTFYLTEPIGRPEQPSFYNGVVEIETPIPPIKLKYSVLRRIEEQLGRRRTADKYGARTIDLDILLYDDLVVSTNDIALPDPDIVRRPFLALPLAELVPDMALPGNGRRFEQIAAELGGAGMQPLQKYTESLRDVLRGSESRSEPRYDMPFGS
jgi:2-amino-4-hydroxy-6-hydroxymethyldihydropteridine diphosphokinase